MGNLATTSVTSSILVKWVESFGHGVNAVPVPVATDPVPVAWTAGQPVFGGGSTARARQMCRRTRAVRVHPGSIGSEEEGWTVVRGLPGE
jgi:hypothetical protein